MFLTYQETLTFLTSLRQIKGDLLLHIFALQFSNTHTFICNKYLIAKKFEGIDYFNNNHVSNDPNNNNSQFQDIVFVNVSGKNDKPTQINPTNSFINFLVTKIQPYFRLQQQNQLHDNDGNGEEFVLYLSKTPSCIITFTGWILEYPVIYALDFGIFMNKNDDENVENNVDERSNKNNLGNQGLILFQLFIKSNQKIPNFDKEESSRHLLLSFTFPQDLTLLSTSTSTTIITNEIKDNLKNLFKSRLDSQKFWDNQYLIVEISNVCLPFVAL